MSFLLADNFAEPLKRPGIVIQSTRFDLSHYQPSLYQQLGVNKPDKHQRAVAKRQAEYLAGRYCAAKTLSALGMTNTDVQSGENRVPHWPQGATGSISHTAGRAVAVAGLENSYTGLGIDCEMLIRPDVTERVYGTIAVTSETALLEQLNWSKEWFLTLVFSAKESLYKALHPTVEVFFGFDSAEVLGVGNGEYIIALTRDLNDKWRAGQQFKGRYLMDENVPGSEFALTLLEVK